MLKKFTIANNRERFFILLNGTILFFTFSKLISSIAIRAYVAGNQKVDKKN